MLKGPLEVNLVQDYSKNSIPLVDLKEDLLSQEKKHYEKLQERAVV
ncbi:hypothetical protein ES703_83405 [subsurface metagenome]